MRNLSNLQGSVILAAALFVFPAAAHGQQPSRDSAAAAYMDRYNELTHLAPGVARVAEVNNLVLTRDVARLVFTRGHLYLLSPVGGRTIGAVFRGEGRFVFEPPYDAERMELGRFAGSRALDEPITEAIMLFSDSTMSQLRGLTFGAGEIPGNLDDHVRDLVNSLKGDHDGAYDTDVMGSMLNGVNDGFFLARVDRAQGDNLLLEIDPGLHEAVQLYRPVGRRLWGAEWAVVTQFPARGAFGEGWHYRDRLFAPSIQVDMTLSEAFSSNLGITAAATLRLAAAEAVGPWLLFRLHYKLNADSARWGSGERAPVFKADQNSAVWIRGPRRLAAGDSVTLTIFYHGDMIDRFGNFFFVDPASAWYPVNGQGSSESQFDLTFHSPKRYPLVSIGERRDSSEAGNVSTTRWVTKHPTDNASFNLGLFQAYHVEHEGAPPLDVYLSEEAHNLLRNQYASMGIQIPQQAHMKENVAADVSNALKLFTTLFGSTEYERFAVTEIPYNEGVSFPGLIHLSWGTFQNTSLDGFDEFFRAHEAAHQWWGNGVQPASYRDAWLSEGLATFCGLWYVEAVRRRDDEYYRFLDQYRSDINADQSAGPIWLGYRLSSPAIPRGYDVIVYEKGAWVFNMLRSMMTDLSTMSTDRFVAMMRDFYQTYKGRSATTDDFRQVVERHIGAPMDWFFDQWVKGTAIPTYHVSWGTEPADNGRVRVRLHVTQEHVPPDFRMPVLVSVDLGDHRTARFRVTVTGTQTDYLSPLIPGTPRSIVFNDMHAVLAEVKMER